MDKIDKLISIARRKSICNQEIRSQEIYDRMTVAQLKELLYENPTEERIKEIFASVNGLHLLESR